MKKEPSFFHVSDSIQEQICDSSLLYKWPEWQFSFRSAVQTEAERFFVLLFSLSPALIWWCSCTSGCCGLLWKWSRPPIDKRRKKHNFTRDDRAAREFRNARMHTGPCSGLASTSVQQKNPFWARKATKKLCEMSLRSKSWKSVSRQRTHCGGSTDWSLIKFPKFFVCLKVGPGTWRRPSLELMTPLHALLLSFSLTCYC